MNCCFYLFVIEVFYFDEFYIIIFLIDIFSVCDNDYEEILEKNREYIYIMFILLYFIGLLLLI